MVELLDRTGLQADSWVSAALGSIVIEREKERYLDCNFDWMRSVEDLAEVFTKYSTDKSTSHEYENLYHPYLSKLVRRKCRGATEAERTIRMLEIGLGCGGGMGGAGGSARAWNDLIRSPLKLDLHVMEYERVCGAQFAKENPSLATYHFGDQNNQDDLRQLLEASGSVSFDVIIDDGSHINDHQRNSLLALFPHVAPSGFYVIEDIVSSCADWGGYGDQPGTGGSPDCMHQALRPGETEAAPTIFATIVDMQKHLLRNRSIPGMPFIRHVDLFSESVVFEAESRLNAPR